MHRSTNILGPHRSPRVGDASGATVRGVLCHTSGLPIHSANLFGNGEQIPPMADVIRRYGVLVNPPGRYFNYSNLGYGVLAYMTSLVARLDWKDYMRDKVFLPLGLLHTSVGIGPGLEPYAAARYDNQNRRLSPFAADAPGASAIWASAHDVVRFGMFQLKDHLPDQQRILSDTTFDLMKKSATGGVPSAGTMLGQKSYGLGWFIEPDDHGYTVGPSGWRQFAPFTYDHHSKFGAVPGPGPRLRGSIRRARQFRQPSKQSGVAASHASRLQKTSCPARIMPPSPYPQRRGRP